MAVSSPRPSGRVGRRDRNETLELAARFYKSLDTKLARHLSVDLKTGRHMNVINAAVDPLQYGNAELFGRDLAAVSLLSKYPGLNIDIDTEAAALEAFRASEELCRTTNSKLLRPYDTPTLGVSGESLIWEARRKIEALLKEFSWNDVISQCGFSTGASVKLRRASGDPYYKFQGKPETTRRAAVLATCVIEFHPSWAAHIREQYGLDPVNWVQVVDGNKLTTVPKNAKTDRVIAIEPSMNMFVQRGIGALIRRSLRRVGIDLNDQSTNQRLALDASLNRTLATLDLKAASDTVSTELVRMLLPRDWFEAMDLVRCESGKLPSGEVITYQKFSSMGNGFTFELESLIFWALTSACVDLLGGTERRLSVYGDDIIVPVSAFGSLVEILSHCGFTTNDKKSFANGPFRESCGKQYFSGVDVTPIYIRKPINSVTRKYWLANAVRRFAGQCTDGDIADPRYIGFWDAIFHSVPRSHRNLVPLGLGDVGFSATFSEALPRRRRSMWVVKGNRVLKGRRKSIDGIPAYLRAMMYGCVGDSLSTIVTDRDKEISKLVDFEVSQWLDAPYWPRH